MPSNPTPPVIRVGEAPESRPDFRSSLQIIRRRKWTLIFVVLLTMAAAAAFSYRQTPMYRSTATVLVKPLNVNTTLGGYSYSTGVDMPTEQTLATSFGVAKNAAARAKRAGDIWGDTGSVGTKVPQGTTFLEYTYTAPDARQAQLWAQAYADGYTDYRGEQAMGLYNSVQTSLQQRMDTLQGQISDLQQQLTSATPDEAPKIRGDIKTLQDNLNSVSQQSSTFPYPVPNTTAEVTSLATAPLTPYSPNWWRNMIMAFIAGIALGLAVVFIRERLDDRIAGRTDLEELTGAPVLAIIPKVSGWRKKSTTKLVTRDASRSGPAEAYRTLRTNVDFMARTNDLKTVAIASPNMGEGKTTTTANLAVALARTGKRVIAVSCDLRKPRLHRFFDLSNDRGFTTIIRDAVNVTEVAQRVPGIDTLRVIASGPTPANPAEILGSEDAAWLLTELRNYADFVVIDTPPALAVSDVLAIAPHTDGVILLVDPASTMRGAVQASREQLELVGANIVGAVFNDFDPSHAKMSSGSYRYHYYSSYQDQDAPAPAEARPPRKPADPSDMWK